MASPFTGVRPHPGKCSTCIESRRLKVTPDARESDRHEPREWQKCGAHGKRQGPFVAGRVLDLSYAAAKKSRPKVPHEIHDRNVSLPLSAAGESLTVSPSVCAHVTILLCLTVLYLIMNIMCSCTLMWSRIATPACRAASGSMAGREEGQAENRCQPDELAGREG